MAPRRDRIRAKPAVRAVTVGREPGVALASGRLQATFLPHCGMLGASLCFDGEEYLSLHGGLRAYRAGHTTGMPILYPWANRLEGFTYRAARVGVSFEDAPGVHLDEGGLPIHGTMAARPDWRVVRLSSGKRVARLLARFDFGTDLDLAESFPFPHRLEVGVVARDESLAVTTTVTPTTEQAVPVSFGWHPYFTIPGVPRAELALMLPKRRHLMLDSQQVPTGERKRNVAETAPLAGRTFDDAYKLGKDRVLGLGGQGKGITIELDEGYPYAQVYAPPRRRFVALEPMTAAPNALVTGEAGLVKPGREFSASFVIRVGHT